LWFPDGDFREVEEDSKFLEFFKTLLQNSELIILNRGIDGSTIDTASWLLSKTKFPSLDVTIVFQCPEAYVREREADAGFFTRTNPYDHKLYTSVQLDTLVAQINATADDPLAKWICNEWRIGRLGRQSMSMAGQSRNAAHLGKAATQFFTFRTSKRNDRPWVLEPASNTKAESQSRYARTGRKRKDWGNAEEEEEYEDSAEDERDEQDAKDEDDEEYAEE
jgi:hypothetical protein